MFEILPFKVDINLIKDDLEKIKTLPITWQGKDYGYNNFGGWSVLSRTGDHRDGWEVGIEQCENKPYKYHLAKYLKISHPFEHDKKTPACIGEINKIIDILEQNGFYPRRARVTLIKANTHSIVHIDNPWDKLIDNYSCRIHIPILTNEKCIHWTEYGKFHMKADGSVYILAVNNLHQIQNDWDKDRYHLIVDAYDTQGISSTLKFKDDIEVLKRSSKNFRNNINSVNLTPFHKLFFYFGKVVYKFLMKV